MALTEHVHIVRSRADGLVDKVAVMHGQRVKKGQLLVALDSADARFEVEAAKLGFDSARAESRHAEQLETSVRARNAAVQQARVALRTAELAIARSQHRFDRMVIVSPVDGVVVAVLHTASPGKKISAGDDLIVIDARPDAARGSASGPGVGMFILPADRPLAQRGPWGYSLTAAPRPSKAVPATEAGDSRIQTPATPVGQSPPRRRPMGVSSGGGSGVGRFGGIRGGGFGGVGELSPRNASASANREPRERSVFARVEGLIEEVSVKVGQRVKKEDLLVRLDTSDAGFALRAAKIRLKSAESEYAWSLEMSESQVSSAREVETQRSAFELARLEVERAMDRLNRMRVICPVDGVVRRLFPATTPGAKVEAGTLLLWIEPVDDAAGAVPPDTSTSGGSRGAGSSASSGGAAREAAIGDVDPAGGGRSHTAATIRGRTRGARPGLSVMSSGGASHR